MPEKFSHFCLLVLVTMTITVSQVLSEGNDTWYNIGPGSENAVNRVDVIQNLPEPTNGPPVTLGPDHPPKIGPTGQSGQSGQLSQTKPTTPPPPKPDQPTTPLNKVPAPQHELAAQPSPTKVTSPSTQESPIVATATAPVPRASESVLGNLNITKPIDMSDLLPVGCYRDSYLHPRPLPKLIIDLRDDSDNATLRTNFNDTIVACAKEAYKLGYTFFGLQAEGECWSGEGSERTYKRDGLSTDCHHGVGKSGSNFVYKFTGAYAKPCKNCGPPRAMCFPASAKLTLKSGDVVKMSDLKIGDEVQTLDPKTNEIVYTEVISFLHKGSTREMFLYIEAEDGTWLKLSHKHLLFSGKAKETMVMKFADEIAIGDFILVRGKGMKVTTVKTVYDSGTYAPMTREGTMLVNGVYVSCYAHWNSQEVSHLVMYPVRLWFDLSNVVRKVATFVGLSHSTHGAVLGDEMFKGIHVYADVLKTLVSYLPNSISDMYHN